MLKMNPTNDPSTFTRREALLGMLEGVVAATLASPLIAEAAPTPAPKPETEFVPENDYPFFGGELPEGHESLR